MHRCLRQLNQNLVTELLNIITARFRTITAIMAALWNRAGHHIFVLWFLSFFLLLMVALCKEKQAWCFSSPNLSGQRLDVYHTSTHGMVLVRI